MTTNTAHCTACNYEWTPKVKAPKACPRCKQYKVEVVGGESQNIVTDKK